MKPPLLQNAKRFSHALIGWLDESRRVWITSGAIVLILSVTMLLPI
jgi:hypothetical protein